MELRQFMQKNLREVTVWFIIGIIVMYMFLVLKTPLWQKALVTAVLIFGGFEVMSKMHGKESFGTKIQREIKKGSDQFQTEMKKSQKQMQQGIELPEFDLPDFGMPGEKRGRKKR